MLARLFSESCMSFCRSATLAATVLLAFGAAGQPRGEPLPAAIVEPRDVAYAGTITLDVDASDVARGIFRVRERIPVSQAGALTLLYPEWLPGKHAPRGAINLLSGIEIRAGGEPLAWRRDPVNVYAFHMDVPAGARALELQFQFVSPTQTNQGRVVATREMLNLQWEAVLLYPAGYYSSRIRVVPSVKLPEGWRFAAALDGPATNGETTRFAETDLTTLVDSPLFAGKHYRLVELDRGAARPTRLNLFADRPDQLAATTEQIEPHRNLVQQAYWLFGSQHFDRYDFLLALTDRMGGIGLEHHRSTEIAVDSVYFTDWSLATSERDVLPHELVHSWNGKFRRPADLWTPSFEIPMRGRLLWVYEGLTQYYGFVLAARSGLWSQQDARAALAMTAARISTDRPQVALRRRRRTTRSLGATPIHGERLRNGTTTRKLARMARRRRADSRAHGRPPLISTTLHAPFSASTLVRGRRLPTFDDVVADERRSRDDWAAFFASVSTKPAPSRRSRSHRVPARVQGRARRNPARSGS
jgi:hypothetical protein